jgi:C4-dicarboxylate-specific signal transduction histidine kinase
MKSRQEDRLREMQLAFIGRLMAGLSHEFKNHLAIIKELTGLIQDLLMLEKSEAVPPGDRFEKILSGINERINLAAEMCRHLSGFAHRMDQPLSSFSITEVLQEEIYLLSRFARQKQVNLIPAFDENLPVIFNNPSLLQFMFFCLVWPLLELLEGNSDIKIKAARQEDAVQIMVSSEGKKKTEEEENSWQELFREAVQILHGEQAQKIKQNGQEEVSVTIPSIERLQSGI